jgi:hypothetical protein
MMGDASDPSLRSPYAYCADDPVYNSDPTGNGIWDFWKVFVTSIVIAQKMQTQVNTNKQAGGKVTVANRSNAESKSSRTIRKIQELFHIKPMQSEPSLEAYLNNKASRKGRLSEQEEKDAIESWRDYHKNNDKIYKEYRFDGEYFYTDVYVNQGDAHMKVSYQERAYSGKAGENKMGGFAENVKNAGPIPEGAYRIGENLGKYGGLGPNEGKAYGQFDFKLYSVGERHTERIASYGRKPLTFAIHEDGNMNDLGKAGSAGCIIGRLNSTNINEAINFYLGTPTPNYIFAEYPMEAKKSVTYTDINNNQHTEELYVNKEFPWPTE